MLPRMGGQSVDSNMGRKELRRACQAEQASWERSAPCAGFCKGYAGKPQGSWQLKPWHTRAAVCIMEALQNFKQNQALSVLGTAQTCEERDQTKSLNSPNLGTLRHRAAGDLLDDFRAAHLSLPPASQANACAALFAPSPCTRTASPGRAQEPPEQGAPMVSHCKTRQKSC